VEILDDGLHLPARASGDLAAQDHRELVGLTDGAIGVQQALAQFVESGPPVKDQVVAVLDLGEEQPMPTAGLGAFPRGEERGEAGEPFLAAVRQVARRQRVGEFLEALRDPALQEGIATLLEVDAFRPEFVGQPVVLVQTEAGREGEIRAHADEHPAPAGIVHVEVVLHDPALRELEMPAIRGLVPVGNEDPRGFAGLEDDDHRVGRGAPEVGLDKFVAPPGGRVQEGHAPGARPVLNPVVELGGDVAPRIPGHELVLPVAVENPMTRSGCWNGWITALSRIRSKHRYPNRMLPW
jgi:hypothetical protein